MFACSTSVESVPRARCLADLLRGTAAFTPFAKGRAPAITGAANKKKTNHRCSDCARAACFTLSALGSTHALEQQTWYMHGACHNSNRHSAIVFQFGVPLAHLMHGALEL
jgi:hypothetical protein